MPEELFSKLTLPRTLFDGWHLTRHDINRDFYLDDLHVETFAANLRQHILRISSTLGSYSYRFSHAVDIAIPKGLYGTRPGSILGIRDRIVLWSIIKLICLKLDKQFPAGVSSYRVKDSIQKGETNLFSEDEEFPIPFLKGRTINTKINPFSHWLYNWREFDKASRTAFDSGYRYLAVTDITAYFENINLLLLRDLLISNFPDEQQIVNLVIDAFSGWAVRTPNGSRPTRGIPQGSGVCSFFGNIYLLPLDKFFSHPDWDNQIVYLRYMDDIRIFCRSKRTASLALLSIEEQIRRLHLSVQSSKTRVYEPPEVASLYKDPRISDIISVRDRYPLPSQRSIALPRLYTIGAKKYDSNDPIDRRFTARDGLFERSTRIWMNSLLFYNDPRFIPRVEQVVSKNADPRYSEILIRSAKKFAGRYRFNKNGFVRVFNSPENIFEYHECNLIEASRYMKGRNNALISHCLTLINQPSGYNRKVAAIRYLATEIMTPVQLIQIRRAFNKENNSLVRCNLVQVLSQFDVNSFSEIKSRIRSSVGEPEQDLANFIDKILNNSAFTRGFLKYVFDRRASFRLFDWIGVVGIVTKTQDPKLRRIVGAHVSKRLLIESDARARGRLRLMMRELK